MYAALTEQCLERVSLIVHSYIHVTLLIKISTIKLSLINHLIIVTLPHAL